MHRSLQEDYKELICLIAHVPQLLTVCDSCLVILSLSDHTTSQLLIFNGFPLHSEGSPHPLPLLQPMVGPSHLSNVS